MSVSFCSLSAPYPPTVLKAPRPRGVGEVGPEEGEEGKGRPEGRKEKEANLNLSHQRRPTLVNWSCSTG